MPKVTIAVDGPAGAGKSTISKIIAKKLKIEYIDTGAMYRAAALKVISSGIPVSDEKMIKKIMDNTDISFINGNIYLDGENVSEKIRSREISDAASKVSALYCVREKLVELQRKMAVKKSIIMDGRDIGSNVLKDADIKIYLTASIEERANRRYKEMAEKGIDVTLEKVKDDIKERDKYDSERPLNPLKKPEDAVVVDTTGKSIDEAVDEIMSIINQEVSR